MEVFSNDLYKDQLTGLDNFFSFIQSDCNRIFKDKGTVLVIDIANFLNFNNKYGRNNGDLCLKCLSDVISNVLSDNPEVFIFRTCGDEFTCIFPQQPCLNTENICSLIKREYKTAMEDLGFADVELHTFGLSYDTKINSVEDYYEWLIKNSNNQTKQTEDKFCGEKLLRNIISGITNRVRDTLTYYKDAYHFALIDDVSGLANHRAGKVYLTTLLEEYRASKTGFSVLFIDGDNLKRYNQISYQAGNDMIKELGRIISDSVRNDDKIYRWLSGDEFLVVLRGANEASALKLADRIRETVEEQTKDLIYPTTVSIGVACCPKDGVEIEEIINKAEKANALAKNSGKNKVVKWGKA